MAIFEPSDLFDFEPAERPHLSTNGADDSGSSSASRPATSVTAALNATGVYSPPPDLDEEPSDFEDEMNAMMEVEAEDESARNARSLSSGRNAAPSASASASAAARRAAIFGSMTESPNGSATRDTAASSNYAPYSTTASSVPHNGNNNGFSFGPSLFDSVPASGSGSGTASGSATTGFEMDFDFGVPSRPAGASSSRTRAELTPPPQVDMSGEVRDELGRILPRVTAATASGESVTFKRRLRQRAVVGMSASDGPALKLLSTPMYKLMREVDDMRSREKAMDLEREINNDAPRLNGKPPNMTMWVDKYRPKKFSDLLGEDRVHREVMAWLKEWDKCVYKRIPPKKRKVVDEENQFVDPLGRPRERVLLLSGPPGYGKTTLAHVVARHAGYRTLEINASDDRSAATVTTRIKNAIDAGSALGAEGRPTCVIIDEIDGASGGGDTSFVRSLIKLIQDVPAKKKSNTAPQLLRRPIVCICNDLYATALRPLRPFARIVRFKKPPSQFIVQRLREICDREKLTADLRVLTSLVDITSGDVRSCLNTLQFIKSKSHVVSQDAIKTAAVGTKDSGTTLQTAWNSLFTPMAAKQRRKQLGIDDGRYVDRLSFMVQACGEYDRVVQGCFEHYPNLKPLDASFGNICRLHDWVSYYDRLAGRVSENMEFELMSYMPYAIVPWYTHFASPANAARPAEWPKADYEAYQTRVGNEEIATALLGSVPPSLRSLFSSQGALIELIPLLMRIISPPLRPVNAHIVKPDERRVLGRLVELMIPLGLKFWQEQTEDGQPMMRLEPAIDVFVHYDGKRAGDIQSSRFAVRQLVAQAMDAEVARRRGQAGADANGKAISTADMLAEQYGAARTGAGAKDATTDAPAAAPTDFFGRIKAPAPIEANDVEQGPVVKRFKAKYKFNEGSSAAVRKPIKMSALM